MTFLYNIGFLEINFIDVLDISLVAILLYNVYKLIKGSVAFKAFLGLLFLYLTYLIVQATEMSLLAEILGQFMSVGVIAAIILFQQELRKFLLIIGRTAELSDDNALMRFFQFGKKNERIKLDINHLMNGMKSLSTTKTGALIVIEGNDDLDRYAETGDILDAQLSKRMLLSIFFKNSPLHDGAVIISREKRIQAARCILPVSNNSAIPAKLGLRHRAAIGMSESTDALVLTVSEETGEMSLIRKGKILHNLNIYELRTEINKYIATIEEEQEVIES